MNNGRVFIFKKYFGVISVNAFYYCKLDYAFLSNFSLYTEISE